MAAPIGAIVNLNPYDWWPAYEGEPPPHVNAVLRTKTGRSYLIVKARKVNAERPPGESSWRLRCRVLSGLEADLFTRLAGGHVYQLEWYERKRKRPVAHRWAE